MSLRVWLPLDGNLNNQGVGSPTITGTATFDVNGKIGKCLNSSNVITLKNTGIENSRIWSVCFWGYVDSSLVTSNWAEMCTLDDGQSKIRVEVCIKENFNGNNIYFIANNPAYNIMSIGIDGSNMLQYYDKWVHFCLTSDGTTISRYLNGVLNGATSYDGPGTLNGTVTLNNNNAIKKNDFRIYDHCLSPKEVKEISKGLCLHYKLNNRGWGGENLIANSKKEFSGIVPETNHKNFKQWRDCITPNPNEFYTCSFDAKSSIDGVCLRLFLYTGDSSVIQVLKSTNSQGIVGVSKDGNSKLSLTFNYNRYWVTWQFNDVSNAIAKNLLFRLVTSDNTNFVGETVTIKNVKLERGSKATPWCPNKTDELYHTLGLDSTIEPDCSGFQHNAERVGTLEVDNDSPRYDIASAFKNQGHIINSDFNVTTPEFTLSMWVKPTKDIVAQHFLFGTFSSWIKNGIGIYRDKGENNYCFTIKSDAEDSFKQKWIVPIFNEWNMLTYTYDGTNFSVYLNGVLNSTVAYGKNGNVTNPVFMIANSKFNNTPASENDEASISDVRFYTIALSEEDIKELYRTSASIADNGTLFAYEFKEE